MLQLGVVTAVAALAPCRRLPSTRDRSKGSGRSWRSSSLRVAAYVFCFKAAARERPPWPQVVGVVLGVGLLLTLLAELVKATVVRAYRIPSDSMCPALCVGDHVIVSKLSGPPPGTLLLGGHQAPGWEQSTAPSVIAGTVYLGATSIVDPATVRTAEGYLIAGSAATLSSAEEMPLFALSNFEVRRGVVVTEGARALVRDDVIAPPLLEAPDLDPETHRGVAVWVRGSTVRADYNRLIVPSNDPNLVVSVGVFTSESCGLITENEIVDYRTPIVFRFEPEVAATFNVMGRAMNGVSVHGNQALIAANHIAAQMPHPGCVYGVIVGDAHPEIRNNTIYLGDFGQSGHHGGNH